MSTSNKKYEVGQRVRATSHGDVISGIITSLHGDFTQSLTFGSHEVELHMTGLEVGITNRFGNEFRLNADSWNLEVLS